MDAKIYKGPLDPRTVIGFHHAGLAYGGAKAVDDVTFNIANGEFVCVTGPSGAGKSSVLRLITMDAFPTSGQVIVRGMISTRMNRRLIPRLRREIGFVFQDFRLLDDRNVYDNVIFAQLVVGVPSAEIKRNVTRALTQVGLWQKRFQMPRTLSGGEQQRVAIARAVVNSPKILLADEPTGNLDPAVAQEILDLLFRINDGGTCVVFSTHDHDIVKTFGQRVLVMEGGRLVSDEERYLSERRTSRLTDRMYRPRENVERDARAAREAAAAAAADASPPDKAPTQPADGGTGGGAVV